VAWFKKTRKPMEAPDKASRVPEGLWVKCPSCNRALYHKDLAETLQVCPHCTHHFRM
jgi:acetyl-CoA carboxylase carboxyl transferase subunit beta